MKRIMMFRWHASRVLAEIGEPAIPQLVSLLSEGDSDVQWHSALTLSMIG
jgi:HEAT repeat protein